MPPLLPVLMASMLLRASSPEQATAPDCPEVEYIELSRVSIPPNREICVSPGLLTGFIFDTQVVLDLQEEVRFMGVFKGRSGISFKPPQDMGMGERLRLKALIGTGLTQYEVVFTLVAHTGEASRQIEVYQDIRPRESLLQEIEREKVKGQELATDNESLRSELERAHEAVQHHVGLSGAYLSGVLITGGIRALTTFPPPSTKPLYSRELSSYRVNGRVALTVRVWNASTADWTAVGASLTDSQGRSLEGVSISAAKPIAPGTQGEVFLEAEAGLDEVQGSHTLTLWEDGPRTVTVAQVVFPR